ncbi:MAG: helix-turn-helix domain-containing protein [Propionibacteriales bacterium]|nr:helix-turn-helix domain-containing protein [Propionibacteriales bacterium]
MALAASTLDAMPPLPLAPGGSLQVAPGVAFLEEADGSGSVFLWGMAAWSWGSSDPVARRLAAVQLVESKAAGQRQTAAVFGVNEDTVMLWRAAYRAQGTAGLAVRRRGPKGPSKLTDVKRAEIRALRDEGLTLVAVAARTGVSTDTVRRALAGPPVVSPGPPGPSVGGGLEPLARPADRSAERQAARAGAITEAPPVICEGASLPLAGALVILPALAATGLVDAASAVYATGRAAFYGLRSLVLAVVFACLWGEPRAEGATRVDPTDAGRLLGLDRAPEVKTLRRRIAGLARLGRADRLIDTLARRHLDTHTDTAGIFYVDGHVRAYHGGAEVPKAHVARIRLAMRAEEDTWVCDRNGDGLLVWTAPPGASLVGELRTVAAKIRALVGADAHPTICFDRGGWSPKLFAELRLAGFHILTYRKGKTRAEPRTAFQAHQLTDQAGRRHDYLLADRRVRIAYNNRRRRFACRQITRLDPATGHQTQILTTRTDPDPAPIAHQMFNRWSQENFFRYMRAHYALDALDSYATIDDDPARMTPNPARRHADRELRDARRQLAAAEETEGKASVEGRRPNPELLDAFTAARAEVDRLAAAAKAIPAKAPLSQVRPDAVRLAPERKRIHDAIRMATYNAESALARLLAPHYPRADDEARSLLREAFRSPADLEVVGTELHVRLSPLSAPRRTRAIAGLCDELTATNTIYPGTDLTLVYTIKTDP